MKSQAKPTSQDWKADVLSKVDPVRTALLVIDLQRDFCSDDGALAALGSDVSPCKTVANRIADFLPDARGQVAFVAFFKLIYEIDEMSEAQRERLLRDGKPVICGPASSGSELCITPAREDLIFEKHRYSAFTNEHFRQLLKDCAISTVAVAGVDTHICVEGTVRHGYDLGYRMLVLSDLVATRRAEFNRHENSLALCERYFALTLDSGAFLELLRTRPALSSESTATKRER